MKASVHWVLLFLGTSLFLLILRRLLSSKGISIRSYLTESKRRRADAETTYFKRFRKASLSDDTRATLRELMFWLDRAYTRPVAPTLEQFVRESGMAELSKEGDALKVFLFARSRDIEPIELQRKWSGKRYYRLVAEARKAQIQKNKRPKRREEQILSLNPQEAADLRTRAEP